MKSIVLATGNKGKIKEFEQILAPFDIELLSQKQLGIGSVAETGLTFVENAIIKARHATHCAGKPAIADDSGLVVPALNGRPGIYSARFAGEDASDDDNIDKLLAELSANPGASRAAYFCCVLVFMRSAEDPTPIISQGVWHGSIGTERQGTEGFGYDPVFLVEGMDCTAAQLDKDSKNQISHRGKAVMEIIDKMQSQAVLPALSVTADR